MWLARSAYRWEANSSSRWNATYTSRKLEPEGPAPTILFFFPQAAFLRVSSEAGGVVVPTSRRSSGRGGRMWDSGSFKSA